MPATEQLFNLVQTSKSSWVAVRVNPPEFAQDHKTYGRESQPTKIRNGAPTLGPLFADTAETRITFSERFPRLTIAVIALTLFAVTVSTEIDLLKNAGYHWR